jgi:excisionase family DNA binding protein
MKNNKVEPLFKTANGSLLRYLELLKNRAFYHDYDYFIVITGKERRGKTTLEAQVLYYMTNGGCSSKNICMDAEEFTSFFAEVEKGSCVSLDEGGTNLNSREAMTQMNKSLTKAFMVSGIKNCGVIVCIPSFFLLDSYIRNHRVDVLIHIPKRGKFKAYSHRRAKMISLKGAKTQNMNVGIRPNDVGWFPKKWPDETLEKEYREKEAKYKTAYLKDLKSNLEGYMTTISFARSTGYNLRTIYRWIKAKKIKFKKVGKRWFIPKSEADRIVQIESKMSYDKESDNRE